MLSSDHLYLHFTKNPYYFLIIAIVSLGNYSFYTEKIQYKIRMKNLGLLVLSLVVFQISFTNAQEEKVDFYEPTAIREFKLGFEQDNWMDLLDSLRQYGDGLLLGTVEIDGNLYDNVGIRYRNTKSYRNTK